ncbi:MAG TPA: tetratricopeptide repeat protein [Opitutaceae bacterium]|jgi:tetratricopeptide (TPR) repeat protein
MTTAPTVRGSTADPHTAGPGGALRAWALAAVIVAAVALAYGRTLHAPTHFDDDASLSGNPTIRSLAGALLPPPTPTVGGRPILNLSFAVSHALSGDGVWGYHLLNIAVHALAALALFGIARRTLAGRAKWGTSAAFLIALLWAVHPLQTESVTYIVQRAESLMGLFFLLSLYFFIRGAASGRHPGPWLALSVASCLLGMGTKEVMVGAPIVILIYDAVFLSASLPDAVRKRRIYYLCLAATWAVLPYLVFSTHGRGGTAGFSSGISWWRYLLAQVPALTRYIRLSLWPHSLVFDYGTALAPLSWSLVPEGMLLVALLAASIWAVMRRRPAGFLGATFFIILAPSSSIVPVASEPMAEHRMYLPLAAVAALVVVAALKWLGRPGIVALGAAALALGWATFERNQLYLSDIYLWQDTADKVPGSYRAHNNLGIALAAADRSSEAIAQYEDVLRIDPSLAEAHSNLANELSKTPAGAREAESQYLEAIRLKPDYEPARKGYASLLESGGRTAEALAEANDAVRLRPGDADAHIVLALALAAGGNLDGAVSQGAMAVAMNPASAKAHDNFGRILTGVPGRIQDAISECETAVRLAPKSAEAHNNLGSALGRAGGRLSDAIGEYRSALALEPGLAQAHCNLGLALDAEGRSAEAARELEQAVRISPGLAEAHNGLGNVLLKGEGTPAAAIAQYREAIRISPDYAAAHSNLASALIQDGRLADGVGEFEEAVRLEPGQPAFHLNLAYALLRSGSTSQAERQLREVLRIQPGNAQASRLLAGIEGSP